MEEEYKSLSVSQDFWIEKKKLKAGDSGTRFEIRTQIIRSILDYLKIHRMIRTTRIRILDYTDIKEDGEEGHKFYFRGVCRARRTYLDYIPFGKPIPPCPN